MAHIGHTVLLHKKLCRLLSMYDLLNSSLTQRQMTTASEAGMLHTAAAIQSCSDSVSRMLRAAAVEHSGSGSVSI